jgi:branched-chain amino acid transport system substrate-binding protein
MKRRWICLVASALLLVPAATALGAKNYGPGVTDTEIKVGQSVPYSGPASSFGVYGRVMMAYFKMLNERGGINGRKINLISLDNGFLPAKALEQSRRLVEEMGVLAEVGTVGTPTNVAIQKYLNSKQVPQLFASAGGSRFNDPKQFRWTVPFYPGFEMEGAIYAKHILKTKPDAKIAILYQNDDYGKDFLKGLKTGLGASTPTRIVAEATYELTDVTVDSQITALKASGADVLAHFSTPKFASQAIRKVADLGWKPLQVVGSPASSINAVLKPAGVGNAVGLVTAQFVKQPGGPEWANDSEMKEFLEFMRRWAPNEDPNDFVGLSGYVNAQGVALVLQRCGDELTRDNLLKQATSITGARVAMLLPGVDLNNSADDYALYRRLRLARFDGAGWVLLGEAVSARD